MLTENDGARKVIGRQMLEQINTYQENYMADYGFESVLVHYRQNFLMERLGELRPKVILEIGCGADLLYGAWHKTGKLADCWLTVEPAQNFYMLAKQSNLSNYYVVEGFFEDCIDKVLSIMPCEPGVIICSCLLVVVLTNRILSL